MINDFFLKVNPPNKAFSNQNKVHLGSRYIYRSEEAEPISKNRAFDSPLRKKRHLQHKMGPQNIVIHGVITTYYTWVSLILFHPEIRMKYVGIVIFGLRPY